RPAPSAGRRPPTQKAPFGMESLPDIPDLRKLKIAPVPEWMLRKKATHKPEDAQGWDDFTSAPERLARATLYAKACAENSPAISGSGGHNQTYKVACMVVKGFHLSPEEAFQILWQHYNPACVPPWSETELRHKVSEALNKGTAPDMDTATTRTGSTG